MPIPSIIHEAAADLVLRERSAAPELLLQQLQIDPTEAQRIIKNLAMEGVLEEPNPYGRYHVALRKLHVCGKEQPAADVHVRILRDLSQYFLENHGQENTKAVKILVDDFGYHRDELRESVRRTLATNPGDQLVAVALALAGLPRMTERFPVPDIASALVTSCMNARPKLSRQTDVVSRRRDGLVYAMRYLERRIMQGLAPHSRAVDYFVHNSLLPHGRAIDVRTIHHEHVVPCAYVQAKATTLLRHGIPAEEVAEWIEPYLRVVEIEKIDAKRLDGPEGLKDTMPEPWDFGRDCVYQRLHRLNIAFRPPVEGPDCTCGAQEVVH